MKGIETVEIFLENDAKVIWSDDDSPSQWLSVQEKRIAIGWS